MAHGHGSSSGRRGSRRSANSPPQFFRGRVVRPVLSDFDDDWLREFTARQYLPYVDLTQIEDRRRWHPSKLAGLRPGPAPAGLRNRPRIVVVPEGHRWARLAPYGGKVKLERLLREERRVRRRSLDYPVRNRVTDPSGFVRDSYVGDHVSTRVGFSHPWQVIICIRRQRRKEVLHALRKTGSGGAGRRKPPHRNEWSEVRC